MITRLTLILLLTVGQQALFASDELSNSIFSAINHSQVIEATITTDLALLEGNIRTEEYQPAEFSFTNKDGEALTMDVEIRPRGRFRRRVCGFPPLKMKFSKKRLAQMGYGPFSSVKLVTHCLDEAYAGKENVLKEYLVYKMYNVLTEKSYRVQLLKINYIDSNNPKQKMERYAFMIEGTKEMSNRLGGRECEECRNPGSDLVAVKDENLMAVFQYMIGNEDWSLKLMRNVKIIQPLDGGPLVPVPYDFDFSGLVNAPYALPNTDLNLTSVKDRALMGWPVDPRQMRVQISFFKLKRPQIEAVISEFKLLSRMDRNEMMTYINDFYSDLDTVMALNEEAVKNSTKD